MSADNHSKGDRHPADLLEQARALAAQVDRLLVNAGEKVLPADAFRVRLARAHALSLLDQLSELVDETSKSGLFRT
jgi:hypothetical protein